MTALYPTIIYGPVRSRRLGVSLGVNLLPLQAKVCTFDCIYCECGWNGDNSGSRRFNGREEVSAALQSALEAMAAEGQQLNVITFAGNGEPTMHPDFELIIDDTLALRDKLCPSAKVSVLSNATQIHREDVRRALLKVDNNILKLDSAFDSSVQLINKPQGAYTVERTVELLKLFEGQFILQTMFLRGEYEGQRVDNTTEEQVAAWLKIVEQIAPRQVMIYSLDRDTPCPTLEKVGREELCRIAERVEALGITCSVA